jgi:hypothetical protein
LTSSKAQSDRDVGLPQAGIADHEYRLDLLQVGALGQRHDVLTIEAGNSVKVEVGQFFVEREASLLNASLATITQTPVGFLLDEIGQVGFVGPAGVGCHLRLRPIFLQEGAEMKVMQLCVKQHSRRVRHALTSWSSWL